MAICPACKSGSSSVHRVISSEEAAQHFVLAEEDRNRHARLRSHIEGLWQQSRCEIRSCGDCGMYFALPFVGGDKTFYNLAYSGAGYPATRWEYDRTLQAINGNASGWRVLEIGAGAGRFLDRLGIPPENITALEYNDAGRSIMESKGYKAIAADVRELALEPFDAIFMFQVLEHMDRIDELMASVARLSRKHVFVSVPNLHRTAFYETTGSLLDMPPNHIGRWTRLAFEAAWGRHGFRVLDMEVEPTNLVEFVRTDILYKTLRRAQTHGTAANRVRSLPRGLPRRILEVALVAFCAPSRVTAWAKAIERFHGVGLGRAAWVHLTRDPR
jgi:SAM-dependent methyltransferase